MKQIKVDDAALLQKSEELQIPFSNLVAGYILEEIMRRISESKFRDYLWLVDTEKLGIEQYRKNQELILRFQYCPGEKELEPTKLVPGQKLSRLLGLAMIAHIFGSEEDSNISWKGNAIEKNGKVELNLYADFEEKEIPVHLQIQTVAYQNLIPQKKELPLFTDKEKVISYYEYPQETFLAEQIFEIMEKMELLPDMKTFDYVYRILSEKAMNVRHVRDILEQLCMEKPVVKKEERLSTIEEYAAYSYMRKRWEKYLRHCKRTEPSWEEVIRIFSAFMRPIWHAVCVDEIFFDDWMPGLGRFLG